MKEGRDEREHWQKCHDSKVVGGGIVRDSVI